MDTKPCTVSMPRASASGVMGNRCAERNEIARNFRIIAQKNISQAGMMASVSQSKITASLRYCAVAVIQCCLSIVLLKAQGTAKGEPVISYQIEGLLTTTNARVRDAAGTPKITAIPFRSVVVGANWKFMIITDGMAISTVGGKLERVQFKKSVSFDGENIFLSLEPTTSPEKTIVTILDHTNFVKAVDIQPECVLWIATCSKQYFSNLGTNQCFAPFSAFGSTREGFFATEVERMAPSGLPSSIKFQPTLAGLEKLTQKGKTDRLIARDLPVITEFYALSHYASQYKVLDTSEFQGFLLPKAFQLEEYYSTNGVHAVAQTYSGVVTNTTSPSDVNFTLSTVPKMSVVWDRRGGLYHHTYRASNGVLLTQGDAEKFGRKVLKPRPISPSPDSDLVRFALVIAICLSTTLIYIVYRRMQASKQENT